MHGALQPPYDMRIESGGADVGLPWRDAQHPAAFADHAAQFWLDAGDDPKKALELAKRNLEVRKTLKAYELAVVAALATHDSKAACTIGTEGLERARPTSMFREIVRGACGRK